MAGMGKYTKKLSAAPAPSERAAAKPPADSEAGGKERATFHVPRALLAEVRDAVVALSGPPERMTLANFAEAALGRELERLKAKHNQGKPFPKSGTGAVRRGRPIGS